MKKNNDKILYVWAIIALSVAVICSMIPASISLAKGSAPAEEDILHAKTDTDILPKDATVTKIPTTEFGFIGDLHFMSEEEIGDDDYASFQSYRYTGERILPLSEAILKQTVDRYIEKKVTAVFVCGDLTETGSKKSLQKVADELTRLTDAGIGVYVCNGTADIQNIDLTETIEENYKFLFLDRFDLEECYKAYRYTETGREEEETVNEEGFRKIFASFGYDNAVATDENSLSYACDVTDTIRLVNYSLPFYYNRITSFPERTYAQPTVTEESLTWLEDVFKQAIADKKEIVLMSYFPLSNEVYRTIGDVSYGFSVKLQDCELVQDLCTQYGVRFVLSGNTHFSSEETFYDLEGDPVCTNITCTSLSNYPLTHYYVRFGKNRTYSTEKLTSIDEKYLPAYYSDEEKKEITSDLSSYSVRYMQREIRNKITEYFNTVRLYRYYNAYFYHITNILRLFDDTDSKIEFAIKIRAKAFEVLDMPFYGENSMDSRLLKYNLSMPKSDYNSLLELITGCFCDLYNGTFDNSEGSLYRQLFLSVGYAVLDIAADFGIFDRLHECRDYIEAYDTHEMTKKVIETGYVNFTWDNLIVRFVSIIQPYISEHVDLNFSAANANTVLTLLDLGLGVGLKIAYPYHYQEDGSIGILYGVPLSEYIDTGNHTMNIKKMCEELFFDLIVRDMLY